MRIYVGNLSFNTREDELRDAFSPYGNVVDARVVTDRDTNRSRGFGFVEMEDDGDAKAAIQGLNGTVLSGRNLTVNEARPRTEQSYSTNRYR